MKISIPPVIILSIILLTACQPQVKTVEATPVPTITPAPTITPGPSPTPNAEQSHKAIVDGLLAISLKASHMEVTTVGEDGTTSNVVVDFLPPDRKHISGGGAEFIVAGGKVYMKTGSKDWFEAPMAVTNFIPDPPPTAAGIDGTVSDGHVLRSDTLNGKDILIYGFTSTNIMNGQTLVSKAELWVSLEDGLPVKYITDGDTPSVSTDSNGASKPIISKVLNTTLIDFNAQIKIEAPLQ